MTTVVGLAPGERGTAAVDLGAMVARSTRDDLVVAAVVPSPWPPSPDRNDAEYLAYQEKAAGKALDQARARLGHDLTADFVVHHARSVSSGLVEVARQRNANLVSLGSSASGILGRVSLGGVAQRILHSTDLPVILAPAGFDTTPDLRVSRVTVGFGRADHDSDLLVTAASAAKLIGAALRVACFAVRPLTAYVGSIEESADDLVVESWVDHLERDITRVLSGAELGGVATRVQTVVGQGGSWSEALGDVSWASGDVLAIGTSSSAMSQFFLGSHASKIVRNSPVPVFLLPRSVGSS